MAASLNVWAWSTTAADNDDADSAVNWAEGQDPGSVNNSARAMMAAIKKMANVQSGNVTVAGTADAITITTGQSIESGQQALGFSIRFKAGGTNTGATTVNVDSLGAKDVKRLNGDALEAGDIVSGGFYDICYDGTDYVLMGTAVSGGSYGTLSGNNTWSGVNTFSGNVAMNGDVTVGNAAGDVVVIKGTTVNSYSSGLLNNTSASDWRADFGLATGDNVAFNSVNVAQLLIGGTNLFASASFIGSMLNNLPNV